MFIDVRRDSRVDHLVQTLRPIIRANRKQLQRCPAGRRELAQMFRLCRQRVRAEQLDAHWDDIQVGLAAAYQAFKVGGQPEFAKLLGNYFLAIYRRGVS